MDGIKIFFSDSRLNEALTVLDIQEAPAVEMYFQLQGSSAAFDQCGTFMESFTANQHNLFYRPFFEGNYKLEKNTFQNLNIELSESIYPDLISSEIPSHCKLMEQIEKKQFAAISPMALEITPEMKMTLYQIITCDKSGHLKRLYLQAKIIELFTQQSELTNEKFTRAPRGVSPMDRDKLYEVKYILENHKLQNFTLLGLARKVGLNDYKLKKGFKLLFNTTVFGYLFDLRMAHARNLLLDGSKTLSISEVAQIVGYSSSHHFARAFKKKYGLTPGNLISE